MSFYKTRSYSLSESLMEAKRFPLSNLDSKIRV
jgi:hypothetical protein